jgi:hypothetical protein
MSYETLRSAYRLWSSDETAETYMALVLVSVVFAPVVMRWWRSGSGQGSSSDKSNAEVRR